MDCRTRLALNLLALLVASINTRCGKNGGKAAVRAALTNSRLLRGIKSGDVSAALCCATLRASSVAGTILQGPGSRPMPADLSDFTGWQRAAGPLARRPRR